eukprot:m.436114 g.436114  ORF g.436114 m.436114 type:complete len:594 (+) comp20266_c0_seq6:161-1942(+)
MVSTSVVACGPWRWVWAPRRWRTVTAGCALMFGAGTIYLTPDWSSALRQQLDYTAEQTALVATLINVGTFLGVLGGLVFVRYGPQTTATGGTCMLATGYFGIFLAAKGVLHLPSGVIAVFGLFVGQGSSWLYTTALNTNVRNFPSATRGKVIGLLASCFGLSSGIFSQFHRALFPESTGATPSGPVHPFLLFLLLAVCALAVFGGCITHELAPPPSPLVGCERALFRRGYTLSLTLAATVAVAALVETAVTPSAASPAAAIVACICLAYLSLPLQKQKSAANRLGDLARMSEANHDQHQQEHFAQESLPMQPMGGAALSARRIDAMASSDCEDDNEGPQDSPDKQVTSDSIGAGLLQSLQCVDFWLATGVFLAVVGSGVAILNNLPDVVLSRIGHEWFNASTKSTDVPHQQTITALVTTFSATNTCGRLASGFLSDHLLAHGHPRSVLLIATAFLMLLVQVYFIFTNIAGMYFGVLLLGTAYGSAWCLIPTFYAERFGTHSLAAILGLAGLAPSIGSELFSTLLAARLADVEAEHSWFYTTKGDRVTRHCLGQGCFRVAYACTALACLLACVSAYVLVRRRAPAHYSLLQSSW